MIQEVKKLAQEKNYVIFDEPFKLNIWGFRANTQVPNTFDDEIHVFLNVRTQKNPKWVYFVFPCTTDPGTFWLKNPQNPQGTAILNPAQYIDTYALDLHRGKYKALCQRLKSVSVTRDYNRDTVLDFFNGKIAKGMFGINIHRAFKSGSAYLVDKFSAGCQVFKHSFDFDFFMKLCELHRHYHGNKFSYTLVDKRMELRDSLKKLSIGAVLVALLLGGAFIITQEKEND